MLAMASLIQLEAAQEGVYQHLKPTPKIFWPLLSVRVGADMRLIRESHTLTCAFKIRGRPYYLECSTKGHAKVPGMIIATRCNPVRRLTFASARQKVPSTTPVPDFSKPKKKLALAELLNYCHRRSGQEVVLI